jgi:Leucine-rich repeat (LRR) protein
VTCCFNVVCATCSALDLSNNKVKGVFGKSNAGRLTALTNMVVLAIADNNLKGKVPQTLSVLQKLQSLNLNNNDLSGRIPGVITKFSLLKYVLVAFSSL